MIPVVGQSRRLKDASGRPDESAAEPGDGSGPSSAGEAK